MATESSDTVSMPQVMNAVSRLVSAAVALAAAGVRAGVVDESQMPAEVVRAVDDVLQAADLPDVTHLPPPQRAMVAAYVRSAFGQVRELLDNPTRSVGWSHVDPEVLEGQGRSSMPMPSLLAAAGGFREVQSFLDVGTGVGWLAVAAAQMWPACRVVGIDIWEPSLERARANVAAAGLTERIEIRHQDLSDLDDLDRFDLTWVPAFFVAPDALAQGYGRILDATGRGGQVVVARYDAQADPLAQATLALRTLRDGGSWPGTEEVVDGLRSAGWTDVRVLPKPTPITLTLVAGRKP